MAASTSTAQSDDAGPANAKPTAPRRPTVAVVIPAYNSAAFIGQALGSLAHQTEPPESIVICDDGSTDNLAQAVRPFEADVALIRQANRGPGIARNSGATRTDSEFILFLDADDWLPPAFLETIRSTIVCDPDVDIVAADAFGVEAASGRIIYRHYGRTDFEHHRQHEAILQRNFTLTALTVRKRAWQAVGGFDGSLHPAEDWDCWMRMILAGSRVALAPTHVYRRHHDRNISSDRLGMCRARIRVRSKALGRDDLEEPDRRHLRAGMAADRTELLRRLSVLHWCRIVDAGASRGDRNRALAFASSPAIAPRRRIMLLLAAISPTAARLARSAAHSRGAPRHDGEGGPSDR